MSRASSVSRNIALNVSGPVLPFLMAGVCIPILIRGIGTDRFGLLTIAWTVIGYFSLFDFGLGRSLTWQVSRRLGERRAGEIPHLVRGALILMGCLSIIGSAIVALAAGELIRLLRVPPQFLIETRNAFVLLGVSIPLVVLTSGLRGVLEALQRFDITNGIRVIQGVWTFAGPVCILPVSNRLDAMVTVLVVGRLVTTIAYYLALRRVLPKPDGMPAPKMSFQRDMLSYGGWTTLSNVLSPVMDYMDRFFIGSMLGTAVVAFYTTPYELVYRLNIVSEGILGVLFPMMAHRVAGDKTRTTAGEMLSLGTKLISASVFPIVLVCLLGAHILLRLWVGPVFEQKSSLVLQLLAVGLLANNLAKVPSNLIQANGRSDITAKLHLLELPVYIACLFWMLRHAGIDGAAAVWAFRMLLDLVLLLGMSSKVASVPPRVVFSVSMLAFVQLGVLGAAIFVRGPIWLCAYGAGILLISANVFYRYVLIEAERLLLRHSARRVIAVLTSRGMAP
ncbi:flippase [Trinickia symbiotica]|uniref:Flippase n=1 Tax=Trinickia symbiotica TaxID=863227 RepID=A0A2T3XUP5_9BURK|nr:flippase [Trinickia symbiotica]PTB20217.1 flippase [Trinickia symbiotica]